MTRRQVRQRLQRGLGVRLRAKRIKGRCCVLVYDGKRPRVVASAETWAGAYTKASQGA